MQTCTSQGSQLPSGISSSAGRRLTDAAAPVPLRQHLQVHGVKSAGVPGGTEPPLRSVSADWTGESRNPLGKPIQDMFDLSLCSFLAWRYHPRALRLP